MINLDAVPYVEAANHGPRPPGTVINLIVLHSGETNEGNTAAEGMANYFASGATIGSTHAVVDNDSVIRCAPDEHRTNGAGGVNNFALHIEQAGRAAQTRGDWTDEYSTAVIANAAGVCQFWLAKYPHIRPVFLDAAALARGERNGITTHNEVSQVFAGNDGHWDPGPEYPIDLFLAALGDDMPLTLSDLDGVRKVVGGEPNLDGSIPTISQVVRDLIALNQKVDQIAQKLETAGTAANVALLPSDVEAIAKAVVDLEAKRLRD